MTLIPAFLGFALLQPVAASAQDEPLERLGLAQGELLAQVQSIGLLQHLIQEMRGETNGTFKIRLIRLLAKAGPGSSPETVPALLQVFQSDGNYGVRQAVCRALGELGPAAGGAVPDLIRASMADPASAVRESCEQAAGNVVAAGFDPRRDMPEEQSAQLVSELAEFVESDSKPYALRAKACGWLGRLGPGAGSAAPGIFSTLVRLGHRYPEIGSSCAKALETIGSGGGGP